MQTGTQVATSVGAILTAGVFGAALIAVAIDHAKATGRWVLLVGVTCLFIGGIAVQAVVS